MYKRQIRYAAKKMGLPMERFQVIIDHVGNVSGASALIAPVSYTHLRGPERFPTTR